MEEKEAQVKLRQAILASGWWQPYTELLERREGQLMERLRVGSRDPRIEERQRGAIAALRWARTFMLGELRQLTSDNDRATL